MSLQKLPVFMKIKIVSPANKMPDWVDKACQEFIKRLDENCKLEFHDIPLNTRTKNADIKRLIEKEANSMLKLVQSDDWVVALSIDGKQFSSEGLAQQLETWQSQGQNVVIFIGGPEGLHASCLERANQRISLSLLTLPHPLVRVLLTEQLYRAQCILKGHPYHK